MSSIYEEDAAGGGGNEEDQENLARRNQVRESIDKLLEEMYNLEFEDVIDDTPTKFRYVQVEKSNLPVDPVDLLFMEEKDLNKIIPMKKIAPYRTYKDDINDKNKYYYWLNRFNKEREALWKSASDLTESQAISRSAQKKLGKKLSKSERLAKELYLSRSAPDNRIREFH